MTAAMANIFAGNPLSTIVGHKIERATAADQPSEDWTLLMDICDEINETDDGPHDAIRAIRKLVHANAGKNYTVVMYTLTVLETCVKNCGRRFQVLVCQKDFVQELIKLIGPRLFCDALSSLDADKSSSIVATINNSVANWVGSVENSLLGPKNEPPLVVQERVLLLVRSWADTFRGDAQLSGVVTVHDQLVARGMQFPTTTATATAAGSMTTSLLGGATTVPIITPAPRPPSCAAVTSSPASNSTHKQQTPNASPAVPAEPAACSLSQSQLDKLSRELGVVDTNAHVFNEMLTALKPTSASGADLELLQQLAVTCGEMQRRLVQLAGQLSAGDTSASTDHVTEHLLTVNDSLNNCFIRYERFERIRSAGVASNVTSPLTSSQAPPTSVTTASLINLAESHSDSSVARQMAAVSLSGAAAVVTSSLSSSDLLDSAGRSESGAAGLATAAVSSQHIVSASEADEMEQWLKMDGGAGATMTSSEFERFLSERASASDSVQSAGNTRNA